MKIEGINQLNNDIAVNNESTRRVNSKEFTLFSNIDKSELKDRLASLYSEIVDQGEKVSKNADIREFKKYRAKVSEFMNEVVNHSYEFSRENYLNHRGRQKTHTMVRKVDKALDDLAQDIINKESNNMKIVSKIEDIKGLILDIMT
ncbi:MAG: YaaR family protein [Clostridia bacterium]|nr:YaaR family protein [Clostridia bacterium]